ncbi:MAG: carboxy-S-adenosyl-L-methionine synthase CmoA [Proteobacteria bacterium]|nr:carboxy-S-adenosyl-L-methionine synthase CmoA [Pseudomonadota bacterium]
MPDSFRKDDIYTAPLEKIVDFTFDEKVATVFADMIQRSVPGYSTAIALVGLMAAQYAKPGTSCYDLGCSLGAAALSMRSRIPFDDCTIMAVDNSASMLERCRAFIEKDRGTLAVQPICADIRDIEIKNASVVVLNYTLQFIEPGQRLELLEKIFAGMVEGGILILSEKVAFADANINRKFDDLHTAFKRMNGYSALEISQKRTALENVLVRDSLADHLKRLAEAGFVGANVCFQCLNFITLVAYKSHV